MSLPISAGNCGPQILRRREQEALTCRGVMRIITFFVCSWVYARSTCSCVSFVVQPGDIQTVDYNAFRYSL